MAGWQETFPNAKVIYTTGGMKGPKHAEKNEESHAFGEIIRAVLRGSIGAGAWFKCGRLWWRDPGRSQRGPCGAGA